MSKVVVKNSKTEVWVKVVAASQQTISMADLAFKGLQHYSWTS